MPVLAPVIAPAASSPSARTFRPSRTCEHVIWAPVDVVSWTESIDLIFRWADRRESRAVCICNVHSLVTARSNAGHARAIRSADLVTPDGAPVAWILRKWGHSGQQRINGPDLMWRCCFEAARTGTEIFLYGGTVETLRKLEARLSSEFPTLKVVGALAPPFGDITAEEDTAIADKINGSGARIVWVGLGCPKQEAWMHAHRGRVNAVMIGVGAAFDFHAGVIKRAPSWMQDHGLEWLHRLLQDPRRLATRYFVSNSIFLLAVLPNVALPRSPRRTTLIGE